MAYITRQEFIAVFPELANNNFPDRYIDEVSDKIDYYTFDRINKQGGLDKYSQTVQELIKNACIYGTLHELLKNNQIPEYVDSSEDGIKSFKLGDMSISKTIISEFNVDRNSDIVMIVDLGNKAYKYLMRSGLAYKEQRDDYHKVDLSRRVDDDV